MRAIAISAALTIVAAVVVAKLASPISRARAEIRYHTAADMARDVTDALRAVRAKHRRPRFTVPSRKKDR